MFLCVSCDRVGTVKMVGGLCVGCFEVETRAHVRPEEEYYGQFVTWSKLREAEHKAIKAAVAAEQERIVKLLWDEDRANEALCMENACDGRDNCIWHHIGFRDAIRFIEDNI